MFTERLVFRAGTIRSEQNLARIDDRRVRARNPIHRLIRNPNDNHPNGASRRRCTNAMQMVQ